MKKYLLGLVVMLLVVTGCGGKKLTCTTSEDGETVKAVVEFSGDKASKIIITQTTTYDEELTSDEVETMKSYGALVCAFIDYEGVACEVDSSTKAMDVTITLDLSKMDDEAKEVFNYTDDMDLTYDGVKSSLESEGYTCK